MQPTALSKRKFKLAVAARTQYSTSLRRHQKKKRLTNLNSRIKRLRAEMEEIGDEQKRIKEAQRKVREKYDVIELECEQLRKETFLITQRSVSTQIRLALMFQILKAREKQEFDKAATLTHALRELIERENQ